MILQYSHRFPKSAAEQAERLAEISAWLRKEREFSFYGDIDFIPTEKYSRQDALKSKDLREQATGLNAKRIAEKGEYYACMRLAEIFYEAIILQS